MQSIFCCFFFCVGVLSAQQTEINYNSNTSTEGPHLLLQETDDAGSASGQDGWARMWFKNSADATNRWGFLARPHMGAGDNDGVLTSPMVMAYTGIQKFGFGSDGTLRINKQYTLPNMDGADGDVLTTDGSGNVTWAASSGGSGGTTIKQVINATDLNPGKDAEHFVRLSHGIYFDNTPYNPRALYSLPIPTGATLNLLRIVALDNDNSKKINIKVIANNTNPGSAPSSITNNMYTTDTGTGIYEAFDFFLTPTIGTTASPDQVYFINIGAATNTNAATTWPGNDLVVSKIIMEYTMP